MNAVTRFLLLAEPARPERDAVSPAAVADDLNRLYAEAVVAPFEVTESGAICGALASGANPLPAIVLSLLAAGSSLRWAAVAERATGDGDGGDGAGGDGDGPAAETATSAEAAMAKLRESNDLAVVRTGTEDVDAILDGILPALADQLLDLTDRQRGIARLALVDGLRQSQVAARLDIKRATVSIAFERAHVRSLGRLLGMLGRLVGDATR